MPRRGDQESQERFAAFIDALASVIGHADRAAPLRDYCTGLLMPAERKSVEPMAAVTAPSRVAAQHQSLLHFVGQSTWSDKAVLTKVRALTLPALERSGPVEAWIIDDTSFPKKGRHSVGVTRQYCGQLGKQDNCQVAVSLSLANSEASLPVAYRLYLPQDWAVDPVRRAKAGPGASPSRPSRRSRSIRSGRRLRPRSRAGWSSWMPVTGPTRPSERA
jgi:SRSO17 transposase